jgi:hypothetical protein
MDIWHTKCSYTTVENSDIYSALGLTLFLAIVVYKSCADLMNIFTASQRLFRVSIGTFYPDYKTVEKIWEEIDPEKLMPKDFAKLQ